jgi:hypothetical protein
LPGIDQIPAELTQARGKTLKSEIHKHFNSAVEAAYYYT